MPKTKPSASLARKIQRVLDAPNLAWFGDTAVQRNRFGCTCDYCRTKRAGTITCAHCGYEGPPIVNACECPATRRSNINFCRRLLRRLDRGESAEGYSRGLLEEMLTKSKSMPNGQCVPRSAVTCAHGLLSCPTCGSDPGGAGPYDSDPDHLLSVIRAVRAVLSGITKR